jgi:hypothetical protein
MRAAGSLHDRRPGWRSQPGPPQRRSRCRYRASSRTGCPISQRAVRSAAEEALYRCRRDGFLDVEVSLSALAVNCLGALGERDRRMCGGVAHLVKCSRAEIVRGVAREVIARVVLCAGCAAEGRGLFGGLNAFGAGEQAAGGDAGLDERPIVGAAVERRRQRRQALVCEVVEEQLLDLR